ncbi:MAG: lipoprotein bor [Alphaproteobacteria bacterium]|nr:lipoprotein bor [Alphaproteobacteria bacterium]
MKKILTITCLSLLLLSACSYQEFSINRSQGFLKQKNQSIFFVGGIAQTDIIDADTICGGSNRVVKVVAGYNFINWFLGAVTFGIYTPRDYEIYCRN